jgi:hypothetical protein
MVISMKKIKMKNKKNKKGWIEIVEAFTAILLVAGVLLILLNKGYLKDTDMSDQVYEVQISILREIQTNTSLRADILNAPTPLPVEWNSAGFPASVKAKIIDRTPNYLNCTGKICYMNQSCSLGEKKDKDVYSQAVTITSVLGEMDYRKLNLFCWAR